MLEHEREVQSPEDPSTLITQHRLADVLRERGRLDEAETEYRAVLATRESAWNPITPIPSPPTPHSPSYCANAAHCQPPQPSTGPCRST